MLSKVHLRIEASSVRVMMIAREVILLRQLASPKRASNVSMHRASAGSEQIFSKTFNAVFT